MERTMDTLEAMETCLAMRYFKQDQVPRADLEKLIYAATRASNPGNSQGWEFIIVTDRALKEAIAPSIAAGMAPAFKQKPNNLDPVQERMYAGAKHLVEQFAAVPAWIVGAARKIYPPHDPQDHFMYSTIYPAAQNLVVAARSMGLGTAFTTFHLVAEPVLRELLKVPDDVHLCVCIAVGYPERKFSKVKRRPVESVTHWNGW